MIRFPFYFLALVVTLAYFLVRNNPYIDQASLQAATIHVENARVQQITQDHPDFWRHYHPSSYAELYQDYTLAGIIKPSEASFLTKLDARKPQADRLCVSYSKPTGGTQMTPIVTNGHWYTPMTIQFFKFPDSGQNPKSVKLTTLSDRPQDPVLN